MATLQDMLDDLNDRLADANNAAGAGEAAKIRYINHGLRAMYPRVYRTVSDNSLVIAADTYEYTLPATLDFARIFRVEIETGSGTARYTHLYDYEIVPTQENKIIRLDALELPVDTGAKLRVFGAQPLTALVATNHVYDGPPGTEEIPVWYALGLVLSRRLENRVDYTRYATNVAGNGVDINEVMNASQFAFAQFELLLDRHALPFPAQAG